MNKKQIIILLVTIGIVIIGITAWLYTINPTDNDDQTVNTISNTGSTVLPGERGSGDERASDYFNPEILINYTELFATSWLERNYSNISETLRLRAQGTTDFKEYFDSVEESLYPSENVEQYFEPQLQTYQVVSPSTELVITQISGTLVTETPGQTQRTNTTVTLELIPTNSDYLIDSVTVE